MQDILGGANQIQGMGRRKTEFRLLESVSRTTPKTKGALSQRQ
jgi:hypothetical protein